MPSDPDIQTRVEVMSKNLRRDLLDFQEFQQLVEVIDLKELSLRWLISISDSYLTRGTEKERAISGIISTFATIGARTIDTVTLNLPLENLQEHHQHLYDGMVSVNLNSCDTYQNYFERIDSVIRLETISLQTLAGDKRAHTTQQQSIQKARRTTRKRNLQTPSLQSMER